MYVYNDHARNQMRRIQYLNTTSDWGLRFIVGLLTLAV